MYSAGSNDGVCSVNTVQEARALLNCAATARPRFMPGEIRLSTAASAEERIFSAFPASRPTTDF